MVNELATTYQIPHKVVYVIQLITLDLEILSNIACSS